MGRGEMNRIAQANLRRSGVYYSKGGIADLSAYLCEQDRPVNFAVSGGQNPHERFEPLQGYIRRFVGQCPIILIHNNDRQSAAFVHRMWQSSGAGQASPLWVIDQEHPEFEPFYGMSNMQVVSAMRQLAQKLQYTVTPRFERVVYAHLSILEELQIPVSLSGLYYLCSFRDMEEFHDNILSLPCGQAQGRRIWADIGADDNGSNSQFDLFRAVINNLAADAVRCGWTEDNSISSVNCRTAIENNATLLFSVNGLHTDYLLSYLAEELKSYSGRPFILLINGVKISNDVLLGYLCRGTDCCFGIVSENIVDAVGGESDAFSLLTEKIDYFIFFKHSTGKTAAALSEIMGKYDYTKAESSSGSSKGLFRFLPRDLREDMRISTENRYRVMPEEIINLHPGKAIVFSTVENAIIHFN